MTATAGGLHNAASHLTPSPCWQTGPSSPARHPIACDSMRAADLRKEVDSCWIQAVTAVLTNYVRTSAGKCGYLYKLKLPPTARWQNREAARQRWWRQEGGGRNKEADTRKEVKRATVWQHNQWVSTELSCKRNTSFYFLSRPPPVMLHQSDVGASSRAARGGAVREQRRGVNKRWK